MAANSRAAGAADESASAATPRILFVTQPTEGGVFRHVRDLVQGLPSHRFDVVVAGPLDRDHAALLGVPTVRLELVRAVSPAKDTGSVAAFARAVSKVRPDVIHAHSSKAGAVARLARVAHPRVPVVYTPHGYASAGYFPGRVARHGYGLAERLLAPLADRVICVCEAELRIASEIGRAGRTRLVHNGVGAPDETEVPVPDDVSDLAGEGPLLCAVSQLRPGKGIDTLVDAMPLVLDALPTTRLLIVGDGIDRAALENRARRIDHAVRFVGSMTSVAGVIQRADVFVAPSWAESFPYTVLEAMALGASIVATDVGGVGEAVLDGSTGLLVPPRDSAALAAAIVALLTDPHRAARLGAAARELVSRRFTVERMVAETASVYRELLERAPGRTARS